MLFNSLHFLLFFAVVLGIYYAAEFKYRWLFLLCASYYFYASWNPAYLLLIILSTIVDYAAGLQMGKIQEKARRLPYLLLSLAVNLGLLFFFKYYNFFAESLQTIFAFGGIPYAPSTYNILLPVGISFYTFQTLSYSIDVYRGTIKPERHLGIFALYVSFFPQLVAGPIERSSRLLPQFWQKHEFEYGRVVEGFRLILWGFFKKLVIADRVAIAVNQVYGNPDGYSGLSLLIATIFFAFQIYCDFSGYSDIAIGVARIMGYDLMTNFRQPYFSTSIREFWQRWHISLSTWFRDYLYIPLGGNRVGPAMVYINLLLVFVVSGLWHGANWTFVIWGFIHGLLLIIERFFGQVLKRKKDETLRFSGGFTASILKGLCTFTVVCIAWVFFRADNLGEALVVLSGSAHFCIELLTGKINFIYIRSALASLGLAMPELLTAIIAILYMELVQSFQYRTDGDFWQKFSTFRWPIRWGWYYMTCSAILFFGAFNKTGEFIYFQF